MPIDFEKRRARWQRNKAAERKRHKTSKQLPPIDPDFERSIWAERDKRLDNFPWDMPRLPDGRAFHRRLYEETYDLICDVWAVEALLTSQHGSLKVSDGKIANALHDLGKHCELERPSLRTKVWRARQVVRYLEDAPARGGRGRYWPKFPGSVAEHGSGLIQHVDDVFARLQRHGLVTHHPLRKPNTDD
jgi:hypothetical protein